MKQKKIKKTVALAILTATLCVGLFGSKVSASVMSRDEIYPLFDVHGTLELKVQEVGSDDYETYTYDIIEENRPLTFLTCREKGIIPPEKMGEMLSKKIEIFFHEGKCIVYSNNTSVSKRIYTNYSANIELDEPIPVGSTGYGPAKR